ncbi:putative integral membrane protein [Paratrimastix pyriformis]|uniref:Integral membrane protein n=1 Tax=Paratrimastix pyriformis TaxID=342808 RepID=A0ABQ8UC55_9EUKA|nr:putative integral membrane protein [Paratrimastix pyriformis]|eukprot:GAFH01005894.1.p2 GENE.GAFH01005894.1~~GAFH01005894.1.p2  ORF type:complete len:176 (-),score=44.12 GAFH01005894.1:38-565(-)
MAAWRLLDYVFICFFIVNLGFITYIVDLEQLTIPDYQKFLVDHKYPLWPPKWGVDLVHSYAKTFDPVLLARPVWWKVTIWVDALYFGPFYALAIYAFINKKNWIKTPAIIWATAMVINVSVILAEETWGPHATPNLPVVLALNAPWLTFPFLMLARLCIPETPFGKSTGSKAKAH